jgi:hypothetical protein
MGDHHFDDIMKLHQKKKKKQKQKKNWFSPYFAWDSNNLIFQMKEKGKRWNHVFQRNCLLLISKWKKKDENDESWNFIFQRSFLNEFSEWKKGGYFSRDLFILFV